MRRRGYVRAVLSTHGFTIGEATNIAIALVLMAVIGAVGACVLLDRVGHRVTVAGALTVAATIGRGAARVDLGLCR